MTTSGGRARLGVAGVGSLGFHHARILTGLPDTEMAGVFDVDPERTTQVASTFDIPAHEDLETLLDGLDGLVIATPTTAHEAVALEALRSGVSVFIEKPIAPDLDAADRILSVANENGAFVQVGHVERFNAAFRAARAFVERPLFIESHRLAPFVPRSTDVAVVLDLMIHDVDLVRALVGQSVESIAASGVPVITSTVDIANARLSFAGGAVANLTASRVSLEKMRKIRIFQRSGYLSLDLAAGTGEFLRLKAPVPAFEARAEGAPDPGSFAFPTDGLVNMVERIPIEGDGAEPLRIELEAFRDAVLGRSAPPVTGTEGRDALHVALAIQELIESHVTDTRTA